MSQPRSLMFALLLMLGACDGVGRALVDSQGGDPISSESCGEETLCESTLQELRVPKTAGDYGDFARCGAPEPAVIVMHDLPLPSCECQSYALDLRGARSSASDLSLNNTFLDCAVHISTDQPVEIELRQGWLKNVGFVLTGPVALRVTDAQLERVRIRSETIDAGAPSVTFETSTVLLSALVNDDATPPLNMLRVSHTTVANSLLEASSAEFASVSLQRVGLAVQDLQANDLHINESLLTLDRALIAISDLTAVKVDACGQVRFVGGELVRVEIAACAKQLQLYDVRVRSGVFDGTIESDSSDFSGASLGSAEATSVVSYDSRFSNVSLCDHVRALKIWGGVAICVACGGPLAQGEGEVCSEGPTSMPDPRENLCPAFENIPTCDSFPARRRPH